jgi:hypothetical protein
VAIPGDAPDSALLHTPVALMLVLPIDDCRQSA